MVFAVHNHQPVGNLGEVMEEACARAYRPFLEMLARHPAVRVNMHWSGPLLEWIEANQPDFFEAFEPVAGQIEWMSGGFYEPIMPAIPENDRIDQLDRMRTYLADKFEAVPAGVWLAERVWDPILAGTLNRAGYRYTVLDDSLFSLAGIDDVKTYRSVDTFGRPIAVFSISEPLRYAIPAEEPEVAIELLKAMAGEDPDRIVVFADDGEKFGMWNDDQDRLYGPGGWFDRFFDAVDESGWIELTTFEKALGDHAPDGRAALPPGSYREMTEWSNGNWPSFLNRYPEADLLHRKMISLSRKLRRSGPADARTELLRGQCNCAYWHGGFGGVHLPHLRAALHEAFIAGRVAADRDDHRGRGWGEATLEDWDADLEDELHVELPDQSWVLDPADGAALLYLDDKASLWPISDVMARHPEAYHPHGTIHDQYPWRFLADHWMERGAQVSDMLVAGPGQPQRYTIDSHDESRGAITVRVTSERGDIAKTITAEDRTLSIAYHLEGTPPGRFGPLLPISVWEGAGELRVDGGAWRPVDEPFMATGHRFRFRHAGRGTQLIVSLPTPGDVFSTPLDTTAQTESGHRESVRQGIVLWPHFTTDGSGVYEVTIITGNEE